MDLFRNSLAHLAQLISPTAPPGNLPLPDWAVAADPAELATDALMLTEGDRQEAAVEVLLAASSPLMTLNRAEAFRVLDYMRIHDIVAGTRIMEEGDTQHTDFVSILLAGEVRIETTMNPGLEPQTFAISNRGTVMGAIGFLDGLPRWGSHTAITPVVCATLTRDRLKDLIEDDPALGAKFLLAIANLLAEVQRDQIARLKVYAQINRTLQEEIGKKA